jgi:Large polyvalent protein-associated domain 7
MASESRRDEGSATQTEEERNPGSDVRVRTRILREERLGPPYRVNSIRPSRARDRPEESERSAADPERIASEGNLRPATPDRVGPQGSGAPPGTAAVKPSDTYALPQSVRDRFIEVRHRHYFEDGTRAFRDYGRRLTTLSENTEVIASLIDIAKVRGWDEITVRGTEAFRREAWREGLKAGLEVRGYRAGEPERAALVRAMARREDRQMELGVTEAASEPANRGASGAHDAPSAEGTSRPEPSRARTSDLMIGKLLDHGREPYRFNPKEAMSYFVEIGTDKGKLTIWGKDLERAVRESLSKPQIGDEVGLRRTGADRVTVQRKERDKEGKVIAEQEVGTERNRWVIEKREFFQSRAAAADTFRNATVDRRQGARTHPELVGTYLQLRAAELASKRIRDPEDQKKFVALVRQALADSVAHGEPLQPVRVRDDPKRVPERKAREREPGPVRA